MHEAEDESDEEEGQRWAQFYGIFKLIKCHKYNHIWRLIQSRPASHLFCSLNWAPPCAFLPECVKLLWLAAFRPAWVFCRVDISCFNLLVQHCLVLPMPFTSFVLHTVNCQEFSVGCTYIQSAVCHDWLIISYWWSADCDSIKSNRLVVFFVPLNLFHFSRVPLSSEFLMSLHKKLVLFASTGFLPEGRSEVGSRLLGRQRRRAPMRWSRICSKGPRSTEPYLWSAVGRALASPAEPKYAHTPGQPPPTVLQFMSLIDIFSWNSALRWRRLQVRSGAGGGIRVCGWREAGRQQPAGREYYRGATSPSWGLGLAFFSHRGENYEAKAK